MLRRVSTLFATAIALVLGLVGSACAESATPAIWKVSDADSNIWLFGSVHVLEEGTHWKTDILQHALDHADLYYYEVPIDDPQVAVKLLGIFTTKGANTDGKQLTDYLNDEQDKLLADALAELGLPLAGLQPMKPWAAALTIVPLQLQKAGYRADAGVELKLLAQTANDKERFFETVEQQLGFFIGLDEEQSVAFLVSSLEDIEEGSELLDKLVDAWAAGDVDAMETLINETMKKESPEVYEILLVNRNKAWAEQIADLMGGDEDILVTVGAGHLLGDKGVPSLLKAAGFDVERVQ